MKRRDFLTLASASAAGLILPAWLTPGAGKRVFLIQKPPLVAAQNWQYPEMEGHYRAIQALRVERKLDPNARRLKPQVRHPDIPWLDEVKRPGMKQADAILFPAALRSSLRYKGRL